MGEPFEAVKISEHVYWVGAVDWSVRDFHGYSTTRGSTYNAYLVMGDEPVLIDTVKEPFTRELLARISSVTEPRRIRYVVSNHSEMDHTGALPRVIEAVKPEKVFASGMGVKDLGGHFHMDREIIAVKDGESVELAGLHFTFLETRMLHWPDSMMTYLAEDRLLFSQDGFGMHLATGRMFTDELPGRLIEEECAKYYANILLPYSTVVTRLLARVKGLGIPIEFICPDHGPIWRRDPDRIIDLYAGWAAQAPAGKAVILYDTMWGSTDLMARAIADSLEKEGVEVAVTRMRASHRSEFVTELLDSGALLAGSPTMNNQMFPTVADALTYAKGLKPMNLVGAAFGSYGWSGEAAKQVGAELEQMRVELVGEPLRARYVPDDEALLACRQLGAAVAARLKEVIEGG